MTAVTVMAVGTQSDLTKVLLEVVICTKRGPARSATVGTAGSGRAVAAVAAGAEPDGRFCTLRQPARRAAASTNAVRPARIDGLRRWSLILPPDQGLLQMSGGVGRQA